MRRRDMQRVVAGGWVSYSEMISVNIIMGMPIEIM